MATEQKNTQKKKMSKARQKRERQKKILTVEFIILVLLLGVLFVWLKFGKLDFTALKNIATNSLDPETKELLNGYTTIAFFGVDNRSTGNYESGNSDSIMICSINNDTKEVKVISVYRDTFLDTGENSLHKCNYAYNHGGVENAIEMLNRNLDLNIQDYVAVDFYALVKAVNAVDGIDLAEGITGEEAEIMNGGYIGEVAAIAGEEATPVSAGQTHLNGVQAVAYCRVRYTAGGDFQRASRQRIVVSALVDKVKGANIGELTALTNAILPEVSTSLSAGQILKMASAMQDYTLVDTRGFPFAMVTATYDKKGSVVIPCTLESNVKEMYVYLFNEEDHKCSDELLSISQSIIDYTGKTEGDALDYGY